MPFECWIGHAFSQFYCASLYERCWQYNSINNNKNTVFFFSAFMCVWIFSHLCWFVSLRYSASNFNRIQQQEENWKLIAFHFTSKIICQLNTCYFSIFQYERNWFSVGYFDFPALSGQIPIVRWLYPCGNTNKKKIAISLCLVCLSNIRFGIFIYMASAI